MALPPSGDASGWYNGACATVVGCAGSQEDDMDAEGLLAVWMDPKPENEDDLNRWYAEEHLPERMAVPGFISARRYVSEDASRTYIALYRLTGVAVLSGEAYQHVARNATPW